MTILRPTILRGTWEEKTRARIERDKAELKRVEQICQHLVSQIKALEEALRRDAELVEA